MVWIDLIYNLTVLIALSVVSGFVDLRWKRQTLAGMLLQGVVFGCAAAIGMLRPFVFSPGVIFDGRSVMISLGAFFFGPWTALVACLITIPLRLAQDGPGMLVGVLVILSSALIGCDFHWRNRGRTDKVTSSKLLVFGLVVHFAMLVVLLALPTAMILPVVKKIFLPVLLTYPLATVLIGKILSDQASHAQFVEALRRSEERHRTILQAAMDGYFLLDMEGHLREVNAAYCRMSGRSEQELLALRVHDLDANYADTDIALYFEKVKAQGEDRLETRHRRKDGSLFDVAVNVQYQPANGGQLVVFLQDISERKRSENALRDSEARYRLLLEQVPMPLCHSNSEGVIDFRNTRFDELFGFTPEEVPTVEAWWRKAYPDPVYRRWVLRTWSTAVARGKNVDREIKSQEYRVTCANGEVIVVEIQGIRLDDGLLVTFNDLTARKKAEEDLQESERRLREAQEMAQLGHWFWDIKTGRVEWSDEVYKIFRLDPATFTPDIGSILALSPWPEDHERGRELIRRAAANHAKGEYEQRFLRPDKSVGYYHSTFQGKYNAKGELESIVGTVLDISERKQAEEYAELRQRILHILNERGALKESIGRVVAEIRSRTGLDAVGLRLGEGDDFPYAAQQGFSAEFLQTENSLALRDGNGGVQRDKEGRVRLSCLCGQVLSGQTNPSFTIFTRGGSFWTSDAANLEPAAGAQAPSLMTRCGCPLQGYRSLALVPIRNREQIVGLIHLADRRKGCLSLAVVEQMEAIASYIGAALMRGRAEEVLRESEEKYRAIITASPVPIALNVDQDITFLNPAFVKTFGYTLEDIPTLSLWWPKAYPDEAYRQHLIGDWKEEGDHARQTGTPFTPMEVTIRCKNGTAKTVLASDAILPGSASNTHLIVLYDITEHKRTEDEMLKMQKLQSIGTLAGGIAHDFNNILQGLFGNLSLAKDELPKEHPGFALLEEAEKSLCMAVRLTNQLLTFAKGGVPVKEAVSLGTLVEEVARFDLSGSPVSLDFRQAPDLWPIKADKGQIQQVLSNLIINARQAMPAGGHLFITLENADVPRDAQPNLHEGKYVKVIVRDEGTGIDPKILGRIFAPYFTTKSTGNGLGLTTVYSIIAKHNGTIYVESELGQGTTFTLFLPASQPAQPAETRPPEALPPRATGGARSARILVMDDEEPVRKLVARILTSNGHAVETVADGKSAIDLYRQAHQSGQPFDLVIMDMTVPGGIGGKEAIRDILSIDPQARALVSSGYAEDPVMATPGDYGFKGAVAKPYTPGELLKIVARILG